MENTKINPGDSSILAASRRQNISHGIGDKLYTAIHFVANQQTNLMFNMDPRCTGEIFKHLEKQNELLTEVHRSMSHELHKLQVEEEMLMRKFYELMTAHGLTKKNEESANVSDDGEAGNSAPLLCLPNNDQQ